MVVVAVGATWWADRIKWRDRQADLEQSRAELNNLKQALGPDLLKAVSIRASPVTVRNRSRSGKPLPPGQLEAEPGVYFLGPVLGR
jgi:hypothetical protein